MRSPQNVLESLSSKACNSNYRYQRLYRNLYNPEFYLIAYQKIQAKQGNMTAGTDGKTVDGIGMKRINALIARLKDFSYQPAPARRTYIPKANGKKRPLGIPSFDDKLVQEVVRMILESIYEPTFLNTSHGFRPKRSCHTALQHVQKNFTGVKWFVEGDIKGCFDHVDHHALVNILRRRIQDEHFIGLIWKFLKAGYMENWVYHNTYSGTPQGSIISPILANIYLNELDVFMAQYAQTFRQGNKRRINPAEVLAVFAARTAGAADGVDVAVLDPERVDRLRTVFWDMTKITTQVETIEHTGTREDGGWTESILHITITPRTPDDMRVFYQFTDDQNEALDELLENRDLLAALAGDLTISDPDAKALLAALPEELSPERRAVVETACSLVGKVNYFWGGKSLVFGWDERWGTIQKVTAAGSSTTGTYRPYGMDCSGFVDWVFYNVTGGEYIIGHGGGATMQHNYCTEISWDEALPGDLVFYPGDEHVGIVGGRDENGELLIVHCAFSQDNVVITEKSGFVSIARPNYYSE